MSELRGYLRSAGRKGIRNVVAVAYLVECAHHVAREIALPWREHEVHAIGFPGCYPNPYAERMMEQRARIHRLGYGDAFLRSWQFYLEGCAAAFATGRCDVVQVTLRHEGT